jgi:serine/threonine protein kinase
MKFGAGYVMAQQGSLSNQKLGKKYLLGELLGFGGFGEVYKAQNLLLNRPQAIKVILEKHLSDPKFRERFIREAQTLARLTHPNILHVDDFEIEEDRAYLVMPFISGGTLHSIMVKRGKLGLEETGSYLRQICTALDYAHARNVVHLDLKPRNLLHEDGTLLLSDFGLAHLMKEGAVEGGTSLRFGSPAYMAPEQISGQPQARSDIYALGVILYQMLAGRPPFGGTSPEAIIVKHLMEPPPLLSAERPDLPQALGLVLNKALAKKPEERYGAAGELLQEFYAALSATTTGAARSVDRGKEPADNTRRAADGNAAIGVADSLKDTASQPVKEPSGNTTVPNLDSLKDVHGELVTAPELESRKEAVSQSLKDISDLQERKELQASVARPWYKLGKRDVPVIGAAAVVSAASFWLAFQVSHNSTFAPIILYFVLFVPPYIVGIAVPALSKRKGVDALFPAFIGGLVSGCADLIVGTAIGGPPPLIVVLLLPLGAVFLFLLGATTYIGIRKLWTRDRRTMLS